MNFVHAADLHLDSPLRGLEAYDGAPVERIREATRRAFSNLVDLCLEERAAFLLLAGDVFDGEWKDFNTGLYFVRELKRLQAIDARVFIVRGNHDAQSEVTRRLELPAHVHTFSDEAAETVALEEHGVALHGLSFDRRAVPGSLVPRYPAPRPGLFNIGLLHTSADGRPGHGTYAPCHIDELVQKGYDYWALGHVHTHELLHERPYVVFPGNLQGRHIKESGPKGCVVVSLAGGEVRALRHQPVDVVRFAALPVELAADDDLPAATEKVQRALERAVAAADGRLCAVRLHLRGACRAHADVIARPEQVQSEVRALGFDWQDELWIESVRLETRPLVPYAELRAQEGFVGDLLRQVAAARADETALRALANELLLLKEKVGDELPPAGLDLGDPGLWRELLDGAEGLLAARLTGPG
jgi:DNA repair exonuclease SbcCD nuclease subunit